MQNLKENWFVVYKWREFGELWPKHSKLSKFPLWLVPLCKVYNVWPKKITEKLSFVTLFHLSFIRKLKKDWLVIWKMTWGIWQTFTRALESLKIGTLMGSFYQK